MYGEKVTTPKEIKYVLARLNKEAIRELKLLFGSNYKNNVFQIIQKAQGEKFVIKLQKTDEPVGLFGIISEGVSVGGIFFLTTENLHLGNKIKLLKGAKRQIKIWEKKYKLILDSCHKGNKTIEKWLSLLGFQPSVLQDKDIRIWYKGDLNVYRN